MSDDEYGGGGGGGGGDYDYGGQGCVWTISVCVCVAELCSTALERMPLFVTRADFIRVLRIDRLRKKDGYDLLTENNPDGEQAGLDGEQDPNQHNGADGYAGGDQEMTDGQGPPAPPQQQGERQPNKVRVTTRYLTKYERARILGTRALQIRWASL